MPEWLPRLTLPDLVVLLVTLFLCLAASRVGAVGDLVGRLVLRVLGRRPRAEPPAAERPAEPFRDDKPHAP